MRITTALTTLALVFFTAGCHEDQRYATELARIVRLYQEQVNRQVKGEQDYYAAMGSLLGRSEDQDVYLSLTLARQERARQDAADLKHGQMQSAEVLDHLRNYAAEEFSQSRAIYEKEMNAQNKYLANLENLAVESAKVEALANLLDDFAKPQGLKDRVAGLVDYGGGVKAYFDKQVCDDLTDQIASATKAQAAAKPDSAEKAAADARIKLLTDRQAANAALKDGKCVAPAANSEKK
jgi:hypothetical protein